LVDDGAAEGAIVHVAFFDADHLGIPLIELAAILFEAILVTVVFAHLFFVERVVLQGVCWRAHAIWVNFSDAGENAAVVFGILLHLLDYLS